MNIPTKQQILEKYRDVIEANDFEILYRDSLPTPEEVHQENASLQYMGRMNGFWVWAKRIVGGAIAAVIFIGELDDGIQTINRYTTVAYEKMSQYVELGSHHRQIPADEYVASKPPKFWPSIPDDSIYIATTTTTTTTTPPPSQIELQPGSGLAPNSHRWGQTGPFA
jgi:hypothetical protein